VALAGISAAAAAPATTAQHLGDSVDTYGDLSGVDPGKMVIDSTLAAGFGFVGGYGGSALSGALVSQTASRTTQVLGTASIEGLTDATAAAGENITNQLIHTGEVDLNQTLFQATVSGVSTFAGAGVTSYRSSAPVPAASVPGPTIELPPLPPGHVRTDSGFIIPTPDTLASTGLWLPPRELVLPPGVSASPQLITPSQELIVPSRDLWVPSGSG
jgi:hypothetical protein